MPLILGGIVMWSGTMEDIPTGWALCDGTNGTLDLRNRFIVCAGDLYEVGDTGGFSDETLVSHNHTITINTGGAHSHTVPRLLNNNGNNTPDSVAAGADLASNNVNSSATGNHSHTVTINNTGISPTNRNLPPYYALAFIQQIE